MRPCPAWFVAGTDTEIGKTLVSCALLHLLAAKYPRRVGAKPVSAGADPDTGTNADVVALRAASSLTVAPELDNPYALREAASPHIAAAAEGLRIDLQRIADAVAALRQAADAVIVEGVGGLLVPLSATEDGGDLARRLRLPVVLVVGLRLGCLNHALLTQEAIAARGLHFAGWVGNRVDPDFGHVAANLDTLRARLRGPCLGVIPHMDRPDAAAAARELQLPDA